MSHYETETRNTLPAEMVADYDRVLANADAIRRDAALLFVAEHIQESHGYRSMIVTPAEAEMLTVAGVVTQEEICRWRSGLARYQGTVICAGSAGAPSIGFVLDVEIYVDDGARRLLPWVEPGQPHPRRAPAPPAKKRRKTAA